MPKAISTATAHFSKLQRAHIDLVRALSVLQPHRIIGQADLADVEGRTDYLRQVYLTVIRYLEGVVDDTITHIYAEGEADWSHVDIALWDAVNDVDFSETLCALAHAGVRFDAYQNDRSEAA